MVVFDRRRETELCKTQVLIAASKGADLTKTWSAYRGALFPELKHSEENFVKKAAKFFKQYENKVFRVRKLKGLKDYRRKRW